MEAMYKINTTFTQILLDLGIQADTPEIEDKLDDAVHAFMKTFDIK